MSNLFTYTLDKNTRRNYPLVWNTSGIPTQLIQDMRILIPKGRYKDIFLKRLQVKNRVVSLLIAGTNKVTNNLEQLAYLAGTVNSDFQFQEFQQIDPSVSGWVRLGLNSQFQVDSNYSFEYPNQKIESSCILKYPTPGVTSIKVRNTTLTGDIQFSSLSLTSVTQDSPDVNILIQSPSRIQSLQDTHSSLGNCKTKPIYSINDMAPIQPGESNAVESIGGFYFMGIEPIQFLKTGETGVVVMDTGPVTQASLCQSQSRYPDENPDYIDPAFKDKYYSRSIDINPIDAVVPEFNLWNVGELYKKTVIETVGGERYAKIQPYITSERAIVGLIISGLDNKYYLLEKLDISTIEDCNTDIFKETWNSVATPVEVKAGQYVIYKGNDNMKISSNMCIGIDLKVSPIYRLDENGQKIPKKDEDGEIIPGEYETYPMQTKFSISIILE